MTQCQTFIWDKRYQEGRQRRRPLGTPIDIHNGRLSAKSALSFGQGLTIKCLDDCRGMCNTRNNCASHFSGESLNEKSPQENGVKPFQPFKNPKRNLAWDAEGGKRSFNGLNEEDSR
ncbi:hypothetical protein TNCV_387641 [Trichonephila clavipes]|nr:hypothetical protein TNCV_387641 [Trichonephila clavipes]